MLVTSQLMNTPSAVRLSDHPQFPFLVLSVIFANVLEALCFIPSTFYFLYHIATKLHLNGRALFVSLFMEHQGVDYILLVGTKAYIMISGIVVLLVGTQDNTTNPVNYIIAWSHTLSIVTFMGSSFRTTQAMLSAKTDSLGTKEPSNTASSKQKKTSGQE
jgi:hypothetical protein